MACRGELQGNVLRAAKTAQRQSGRRLDPDHIACGWPALRDRDWSRLQRCQEGHGKPQGDRCRGPAAAAREAAATAAGHAETAAAASDSAAARAVAGPDA